MLAIPNKQHVKVKSRNEKREVNIDIFSNHHSAQHYKYWTDYNHFAKLK